METEKKKRRKGKEIGTQEERMTIQTKTAGEKQRDRHNIDRQRQNMRDKIDSTATFRRKNWKEQKRREAEKEKAKI